MYNNVVSIHQTKKERDRRKKQIEERGYAVGSCLRFCINAPHLRVPEEVGFLKIVAYDTNDDCYMIDFEGNLYVSAMAAIISALNGRESYQRSTTEARLNNETILFVIPTVGLEKVSLSVSLNFELKQTGFEVSENAKLMPKASEFIDFLLWSAQRFLNPK